MNSKIALGSLVVVVAALVAVGAYVLTGGPDNESPFVGTWEMTSGTHAGYDSDGNQYTYVCENDSMRITRVKDGFAEVWFGDNSCIGVCNGNTITCYATGSSAMPDWIFHDTLTLVGETLYLTYVGYDTNTLEYRICSGAYHREGRAPATPEGKVSPCEDECPLPLGTDVEAFEAYTVRDGVKTDILSNGYSVRVTRWEPGYHLYTSTFVEGGIGKTFNYVSTDIGSGVHMNICRNADSVLIDYMIMDGNVVSMASSNWDGSTYTMYVVKFRAGGEPVPCPDYSFLRGKVYKGEDVYATDGVDDVTRTGLTLTVLDVVDDTVTIRTEFGGNTSEWGAILAPREGSDDLTILADARFTVGSDAYSGIYRGVLHRDSGRMTITGNAYSGPHDLGLVMDLSEQR